MFDFNPFAAAYFQFYILQLEEYDLSRFIRIIFKIKKPKKLKKSLVFTPKAILLCLISVILIILFSYPYSNLNFIYLLIYFYISFQLFFVYLIISSILIYPLDYMFKNIIIFRAKNKINKLKNLKIIGIAGSYGKTTFKEILYTILREKYNVIKTPENINTPLGISRLISKKVDQSTEIFIVEMGEYYRHDIKKICQIVGPDMAVVTGINEAHFERLKSEKNTISTIFEIVENSKQNSVVVSNADDELIMKNYSKYIKNKKIYFYGTKNFKSNYGIRNMKFDSVTNVRTFELIYKKDSLGLYKTSLLGEYVIGDILGCIQIAKHLNLSDTEIKIGIENIIPIPHRLQPIINSKKKIVIIDDSYNGNSTGVNEAIKVLNEYKSKRKIFVTPGIAETGDKNRTIHFEIGKKLSKVADLVVLINNSATPYIKEGLLYRDFSEKNILFFNSSLEAYEKINKILKPNDVILFQNDWPENYL